MALTESDLWATSPPSAAPRRLGPPHHGELSSTGRGGPHRPGLLHPGGQLMTSMTDTAAQAAIGAAVREPAPADGAQRGRSLGEIAAQPAVGMSTGLAPLRSPRLAPLRGAT